MSDCETTIDDVLTTEEAAEILGRTITATTALFRRGSMRAKKLGRPGVWVTTRYEVQQYAAWARTHHHHERKRPATGRFLKAV